LFEGHRHSVQAFISVMHRALVNDAPRIGAPCISSHSVEH